MHSSVRRGAVFLFFRTIFVPSFIGFTIFFYPCHCFCIFFFIINTFVHTAEYFHFVHAFIAHTEVFLEKVLIDDAACYTHALAAYRQVTFTAHLCDGNGGASPAENLFGYVFGDSVVVKILHIVPVDSECG